MSIVNSGNKIQVICIPSVNGGYYVILNLFQDLKRWRDMEIPKQVRDDRVDGSAWQYTPVHRGITVIFLLRVIFQQFPVEINNFCVLHSYRFVGVILNLKIILFFSIFLTLCTTFFLKKIHPMTCVSPDRKGGTEDTINKYLKMGKDKLIIV